MPDPKDFEYLMNQMKNIVDQERSASLHWRECLIIVGNVAELQRKLSLQAAQLEHMKKENRIVSSNLIRRCGECDNFVTATRIGGE